MPPTLPASPGTRLCARQVRWGPSERMAMERGWMGGGGEALLLEGAHMSQLCYSVAG